MICFIIFEENKKAIRKGYLKFADKRIQYQTYEALCKDLTDEQREELLDIENVRYKIALDDKLDLQKVSKIVLGYEMTYADDDTDFEFIDYTPQWYVKYDGVWMKFNKGGLS